MNDRLDLQNKLSSIFESKNVYYQPPENLKMNYPCIKYSKADITSIYADNVRYIGHEKYEITVIDKKMDNPVIKRILELPNTSYDRHYVSDNLNHDTITIFI